MAPAGWASYALRQRQFRTDDRVSQRACATGSMGQLAAAARIRCRGRDPRILIQQSRAQGVVAPDGKLEPDAPPQPPFLLPREALCLASNREPRGLARFCPWPSRPYANCTGLEQLSDRGRTLETP